MITYHYSSNMNILFIGINPHPGSYRRGVPFSNNKMFWYLLNDAGILNENKNDLKDDAKLFEIYSKKFNQHYRLGLVNVIDRPSNNISDLKKDEELKGRQKIYTIIKECRPQVVCFVGKITYQKFIGLKMIHHGWQTQILDSKIYVMHTPLRGHASIRIDELREIKKSLST